MPGIGKMVRSVLLLLVTVGADGNSYSSNSAGPSEYSNKASTTPEPPTGVPILYADPASHTTILLKWSDVQGETQYRIERKNQYGNWSEIGANGGNSGNFLDDELTPLTVYSYRVRGWNQGGFSAYSNESAAMTLSDPDVIPPAPNIVSFGGTDTSIQLQWRRIDQAVGYRLEAKMGEAGTWTEITNVTGQVTYYIHENLLPSTEYFYRIRAYNAAGISEYSYEWREMTLAPPPLSPELQATARSYNEIELHWTDVLTNCCTSPVYLGYRLQTMQGGEWQDLEFAGVDDTNYFVGGLQPSTEYSFRIKALRILESEWSTATVTTLDPPPIPPQVAPLLYADPDSFSSVRLKWLDVELETEYRIERKNSAGQWEQIGTAPANSLFYIDAALEPSTSYAYRIRAANSYGASAYSNEAGAITRPPPHPAHVPILSGGSSSQAVIQLFWNAAEGATFYRLERKNAAGDWDPIYETASEPFGYHDNGLAPYTVYTYRLGAQNAAGTWFYSAEISDRTFPPPLTQAPVASGRAISSSAIELSWEPIPYAQFYFVAKLMDGGWTHTQLPATATNYIDSGLSSATSYTYIVYARNDVGTSPESPAITVITHSPISGAISFRSILLAPGNVTFRFAGSTGQKFKIQSSSNFAGWTDATGTLTLSTDLQADVERPSDAEKLFYRTVRVE